MLDLKDISLLKKVFVSKDDLRRETEKLDKKTAAKHSKLYTIFLYFFQFPHKETGLRPDGSFGLIFDKIKSFFQQICRGIFGQTDIKGFVVPIFEFIGQPEA